MRLPPGVVDPIFLCELALELGMPVGEMTERMSAHELSVTWPAFFRARRREQERVERDQDDGRRRRGASPGQSPGRDLEGERTHAGFPSTMGSDPEPSKSS